MLPADQNGPNFDDMSDDAAATEFENTFSNLVHGSSGQPEDISAAVDNLLETLNICITKASTIDDLVGFVFECAAGGQVIHYVASNFLACLTQRYTQEVQGRTISNSIINKLREIAEKCIFTMEQLASGNADPVAVGEARNLAMFFADFAPKVLVLPGFKVAVPAIIYTVFELMDKFVAKATTVPRSDFLENCFCAVQMLKMMGPTIDELIREDASISQRIPGVVPKLYQTIRNILIDTNDLTPRIRAGIIKVLEFRASRWGEVLSPDKPLEVAAVVGGHDEVDPTWYGPDGQPINKEEAAFLNAAANEACESEEEEEEIDQGEAYRVDGHHEEEYEEQVDENQAPPPVYRYIPEQVPEGAMEEFRRRLKPDYKPDGAGDRLRANL
ncbi:hypothetical protein BV898_15593 [Hypsibius exemplaris]|uniref:Uncharacterized protein n=1 Tax=Hypsibius exemplaris TaxID=2072580 RepID=A0A9X6RKG9_HYPEX|nr:hypothetical protein BV898_15593 [Hypsibius exemplaris]